MKFDLREEAIKRYLVTSRRPCAWEGYITKVTITFNRTKNYAYPLFECIYLPNVSAVSDFEIFSKKEIL